MKTLRALLCGLALLSGLLAGRASLWAQPRSPDRTEWEVEVQGYGATVSDAERDAVENAAGQLREYLAGRYPTLTWSPDSAYLWRKSLVHLRGAPVEKTLDRGGAAQKLQEVTLRLTLTGSDIQQIEQRNQEQVARNRDLRSKERHHLLALITVGMAAGLVLLKLYLWLEEVTHGYSTGLLRGIALVLLGLVIAVLIWIA